MKINKLKKNNVLIGFENDLFQNIKIVSSNSSINDPIVYIFFLPDYLEIESYLYTFLDSKETERANKYYRKKDKSRFIICRSLLKLLLSIHTKITLSDIKIDYFKNKKPYLSSNPSVYFNVSHSEEFGLITISNHPVGIDIEFINLDYKLMNTLEYIFNKEEISYINNAQDKTLAFYSLWTRKEAFVKALGKGIDDDFSKVPSLDGTHTLDISIFKNNKNWKIQGFELNKKYIGAIAYNENPPFSNELSVYSLPKNSNDLLALLPK